MRSRFRVVSAGLWVLISVGAPYAGLGDELRAPSSVVAQIDGSFSYQAKFYKGPGTDDLASSGWIGEENVGGGLVGDCFCIAEFCAMEPGDSLAIQVAGQLTDPTQPGRVGTWVNLCMSPGQAASTTILSYWTTAVDGPAPSKALRFWNAPNPVLPSTTFHWDLPKPGLVQLRVYDVAGRLLATVVDEVQPAGHHRVLWDARTVPAIRNADGVYFARLSVLGRSTTRPIVVMLR